MARASYCELCGTTHKPGECSMGAGSCQAKWAHCKENKYIDNLNRERMGQHECNNPKPRHNGKHKCAHCGDEH